MTPADITIVIVCPLTKFEDGSQSLYSVDDDAGNHSDCSARRMKLVVQIYHDAAEQQFTIINNITCTLTK